MAKEDRSRGLDARWLSTLAASQIEKPKNWSQDDLKDVSGSRKAKSKLQEILQEFYYALKDRLKGTVIGDEVTIDGDDLFDSWYTESGIESYQGKYNLMQAFNSIAGALQLGIEASYGKDDFERMFAKISQRCIEEQEYLDEVKKSINDKYEGLIGEFKYEPSATELNKYEEREYNNKLQQIERKIESNVDEYADLLEKIDAAKKTNFEQISEQLNEVVIWGVAAWELILYGVMSVFSPRIYINNLDRRSNMHCILAGDISTAKSIDGENNVFIVGEGIKKIGQVIDDYLINTTIHKKGDTEWAECKDLKTYAINTDTFQMEVVDVKRVIRHKAPEKLYRVKTESGRILDGCTKDHSFLVLENGDLIEKEVSVGDYIPTPRKLPLIGGLTTINVYSEKYPKAKRIPPIKLDYLTGYAVGVYLAEGSEQLGKVRWTTSKSEVQVKVATWINRLNLNASINEKEVCSYSRQLSTWFHETCYYGEKTKTGKGSGAHRKIIPNYAFHAPKEFREGLIEGYLLDGTPRRGWHDTYQEPYVTSASYELHSGLAVLLATLDKPSKLSEVTVNYKGKGRHYSSLTIHQTNQSKAYYDIIPNGVKLIYPYVRELGWCKRASENRDWAATLRTRIKQETTFREQIIKDISKIESEGNISLPQSIKRFETPDIIWDKVVEVKEILSSGTWVYDFSTEYENFVAGHGGLITHNSGVLKVCKLVAPKFVIMDDSSKATFEGIANRGEIEEGVLDWAKDGIILVEELSTQLTRMKLFRRAMDCEDYGIHKGGSSKVASVNTTMIAACNPDEDFFQEETSFRSQIPYKEGILSRFDVLIPLTATPEQNEMILDGMTLFEEGERFSFRDIKTQLNTLSIGMKNVTRVVLTPEQTDELKEAFRLHNDRDKRKSVLKFRPLVILRDLETLARFVNTIATVNFSKREVDEDGVLHAEDLDIEKAIQLWENLLAYRVQLYSESPVRNLKAISDEMVLYLFNNGAAANEVALSELYDEFINRRKMFAKSTFYKEVDTLIENGRLIAFGERNRTVKLIVR